MSVSIMNSLSGKVALITGASSGIGAGTAVLFASLGCKLSLCGRNLGNLATTAENCAQAGLNHADIQCIVGDLSLEDDIKNAVQKTIEYHKQLDILVNSAGILIPGDTETTSLETFDKLMNINVRSVFYITQLAIPHLLKTKGNIVNVSSVAGTRSFPGIVSYCTSKAAVDQLTKCVSLELASKGVRVNSVNPGVIITEIHKRGGMSEEQYKQFLEHSKETHALGRPGTTEEVASAIAFLASDQASFITAVNLPIDGGRSAMCPR